MKADERLAEIRFMMAQSSVEEAEEWHIPWLLERIDQLERLVPDAIVLKYIVEHQELDHRAGWGVPIEVERFEAAIRKYREGK